jgi:hypothetical protein
VRVPLLDHRVVEFAWTLPTSMKIDAGATKRVLRDVLYRYVPPQIIDRPKMGFGVPLGDWLRGPLREWAEDLLDEQRLRDEGLLEPGPVRALWTEHLSGRRNWQTQLWCVLMFSLESRAMSAAASSPRSCCWPGCARVRQLPVGLLAHDCRRRDWPFRLSQLGGHWTLPAPSLCRYVVLRQVAAGRAAAACGSGR